MQQPEEKKVESLDVDVAGANSKEGNTFLLEESEAFSEGEESSIINIEYKVERPSSPALSTASSASQVSTTSTIKYDPNKAYSSSVHTFFALREHHVTLSEFQYNPLNAKTKKKSEYKAAKFVALELLALWTPRAEDMHNHTIHYLYQDTDDLMMINPYYPTIQTQHYTKLSPSYVRKCFETGETLHLGSLLFLNHLLDGELTDKNLGIDYGSPSENYFVQHSAKAHFFRSFLSGNDRNYSDFNLRTFFESSQCSEWWEQVLPNSVNGPEQTEEYLRRLFLQEVFEAVLRVYFTPDRVIELIVSKLLEPWFTYSELIGYITKIKNRVLRIIILELTENEYEQWTNFFQDHSLRVYEVFRHDLHVCLTNFSYPAGSAFYRSTMIDLEENARSYGVPNLSSNDSQGRPLAEVSNFVGLELLGLWVTREDDDNYNNTIHHVYNESAKSIIVNSRYPSFNVLHYSRFDSNLMRQSFENNDPQHLGSLLFLNYLLDGVISDKNLGVSFETRGNYFVQGLKGSAFFRRFLRGEDTVLDKHDFMSFFDSSDYTYWWDNVVPENIIENQEGAEYLRRIFLGEVFETVLRIHLTPDKIIELIVNKLSGKTNVHLGLIEHIKQIKNSILTDFITSLSEDEHKEWHTFIQQHGFTVYEIFRKDLHVCLANFDVPRSSEVYSNALLDLIVRADKCKIPNLLVSLRFNRFGNYKTAHQKANEVAYFFEVIVDNFQLYGRFKDYIIWRYLDQLCDDLHTELTRAKYMFEDNESEHPGLQLLMMAACRFQFNNICRFLLLQYPFLAKDLIIERVTNVPPYLDYGAVPMVIYATNIGNETVADYIELARNNKLSDKALVVQTNLQPPSIHSLLRSTSMDFSSVQSDEPPEKSVAKKQGLPKSTRVRNDNLPKVRQTKSGRQKRPSFTGWADLERQTGGDSTGLSLDQEEPVFEDSPFAMTFEQYKETMLPQIKRKQVDQHTPDVTGEAQEQINQVFFPPISKHDIAEDEQYKEADDGTIVMAPYGGYGKK